MSTDEQRRPSTEAGRDWLDEMVADYEPSDAVEGTRLRILAIEAEANWMRRIRIGCGAERDRLEAALREV